MPEEQLTREQEQRAAAEAADAAASIIEALLEESRAAAEAAAVAASVAADQIEGLRLGMAGRLVIGQAQGVLMTRYDLDADQAFAYLLRASSTTNTKLRDVAAEIVRTKQAPNLPDPA